MRIADEIDHVMREFVDCEDFFAALIEEQGLEEYQIVSWLSRNREAFTRIPMIECNHQIRDFRLLEDGWIGDVLFMMTMKDGFDWENDLSTGYRAGWLRPGLIAFFKSTGVEFPEAALARLSQKPIPENPMLVDLHDFPDKSDSRVDEDKVLGTRERTTLLTIIAALASEAKIELVTPSKSAELVASITERMGAPVAKRTIEEHLKRVPEALERKSR